MTTCISFFSLEIISTCLFKIPFSVVCLSLTALQNSFSRWHPSNPQEEKSAKVQRRAWEDGEQTAPRLPPQPSLCPVVGSVLPSPADQRPYLFLPSATLRSALELGSAPSPGSPQLLRARVAPKGICSGRPPACGPGGSVNPVTRSLAAQRPSLERGPTGRPQVRDGTEPRSRRVARRGSPSLSSRRALRPGSPPLPAPGAPGAAESPNPGGGSAWCRVTGHVSPWGRFGRPGSRAGTAG